MSNNKKKNLESLNNKIVRTGTVLSEMKRFKIHLPSNAQRLLFLHRRKNPRFRIDDEIVVDESIPGWPAESGLCICIDSLEGLLLCFVTDPCEDDRSSKSKMSMSYRSKIRLEEMVAHIDVNAQDIDDDGKKRDRALPLLPCVN